MNIDEIETIREVIETVVEIQQHQSYIMSAKIQYEVIVPLEDLIMKSIT